MIRALLFAVAGLVLGAIIHIAVILALPSLGSNHVWEQLAAMGADKGAVVLPQLKPGEANPLRLDPELVYAACQLDLGKGPGTVKATLPQTFWSITVYNRSGTVIYSTTNRDGIGNTLDLGLFDQAQTRLLAEQKLEVADGLLIVEAQQDDVQVVVRVAPPQPQNRPRYVKALSTLSCSNIVGQG
jgi:uncharacterized membrane protein